MRSLSDQFAQIFWQKHREVQDTLLDLLQSGLSPIQLANETERRSIVVAE
jgi:hypothetical protein